LRIAPYCDPQHTIGAHRDGKLLLMNIIKFRPLLSWFSRNFITRRYCYPPILFTRRLSLSIAPRVTRALAVSEVLGGRKI
jgi:hypothetical protein